MPQTSPSPPAATVSVHALSCGHFTLPEHQFVKPSSLDARRTVPSLAFLIQHQNSDTGKRTNILFDLGLRGDLNAYPAPVQKHIESRKPIESRPDVVENLAKGGLGPEDIDYIILSHVHWDHIGTPSAFPTSTFIVGPGSLDLLSGKTPPANGTHSFFERDLLPLDRTIELSKPLAQSKPGSQAVKSSSTIVSGDIDARALWLPHGVLPHTLDLFGDGSLRIVNAPGHLQGHINILARTSSSPDRYMYLAGDACHDRRLLTGEKEIGEWVDAGGRGCCIHVDREEAEKTIERIRKLEEGGVEVVFAHDGKWERKNRGRFWGA